MPSIRLVISFEWLAKPFRAPRINISKWIVCSLLLLIFEISLEYPGIKCDSFVTVAPPKNFINKYYDEWKDNWYCEVRKIARSNGYVVVNHAGTAIYLPCRLIVNSLRLTSDWLLRMVSLVIPLRTCILVTAASPVIPLGRALG